MNAAARLVYQGNLSSRFFFSYQFKLKQIIWVVLLMTILLSAFSLVSVTHVSRLLRAEYQQQLIEQDRLHVEQGQLLLERSTWMMQGRIQQFAEKKLDMVMPDHPIVIMVK